MFFFFKQKTAYEMRISDWSSDVCSSDLDMYAFIDGLVDGESFFEYKPLFAKELICGLGRVDGRPVGVVANNPSHLGGVLFVDSADKARSDERRVGKACVRTCRSRWSPSH